MAEGINNNFTQKINQESLVRSISEQETQMLPLFAEEILEEETNSDKNEINATSEVDLLYEEMEKVNKEQGLISSLWNGLKCATNIGSSTEKCDGNNDDYVEMLAFGELLEIIKAQDMITYSMLSNSYADIYKGEILKIYVNSVAHLMLSGDAAKNALIQGAASKLLGMNVRVEYVITTELKKRDNNPSLDDF